MNEPDFKLSPEAREELNEAVRNTGFELSPEAQEELNRLCRNVVEAINKIAEVLNEIVQQILEMVRRIAAELGRFFLKQQLLEWRVPRPMAELIANRIYWYWYWAWVLGMRWFRNKFLAAE